ncbi:RNA binding protein [Mycena kentingensis (nom. inval.)]|nr:RNA binding protein [Mycena kentingensis (nom. inval.)]
MPHKNNARLWANRFETLPSSPPPSPGPHEPAAAAATDTTTVPDAQATSTVKKVAQTPHDASVFVGSLPPNADPVELTRLLGQHLSEYTEVKGIKMVRDAKGGACAFVQCQDAAAAAALINTLKDAPQKPFLGRVLRYEPARAFRTLYISYREPVQYIPAADGKGPQTIHLDLPSAMRMCRARAYRFISITYNDEAIDTQNNSVGDDSGDQVLFMKPVEFDGSAVQAICEQFGPLEHFGDLDKMSSNDDGKTLPYPAPHCMPRRPGMHPGVFEVKWAHRDNAVSALMTLRRVPHLTVTWAHQHTAADYIRFEPQLHRLHHHHHQNNNSQNGQASGTASSDINPFSTSLTTTDDWHQVPQPALASHVYDPNAQLRVIGPFEDGGGARVEWTSDVDFPPLGDRKSDRRKQRGVWANKNVAPDMAPTSLSVVTAEVSRRQAELIATASVEGHENEQELDMPDTPPLGMSPITPKTTDSEPFPPTPTTAHDEIPENIGVDGKEAVPFFDNDCKANDIDPTTLFVGGLEMFGPHAWDENSVAAFFGKYGGLVSVNLVKPVAAKAAFAFVKFDNTDSPARAVYEEHNSIHNGRAIRVQLRSVTGRGFFNRRGRGRFPQHAQRRVPQPSDRSRDRSAARPDPPAAPPASDDIPAVGDVQIAEGAAAAAVETEVLPSEIDQAASNDEKQPSKSLEIQSRSAPVSRRATPEPAVQQANAPTEYREWYDAEPAADSATMTPPPGHATAVPAGPYGAPGGYYPVPWQQPYQHPLAYGMPFYQGYPPHGYPLPVPPSRPFSSPGGSDASGPASVPPPHPWPAMYGVGYVHYPAFSGSANGVDKSGSSQAPLQPTGFMQSNLGTLIPVYPPDALDQYMATNHHAQATSTPPQQPAQQQQQQSAPPPHPSTAHGPPAYQPFPPPPYAFPNAMHPLVGMAPREFPPQHPASAAMNGAFVLPHHIHNGQSPNLPHANFRPAFPDVSGGRRQPIRRDSNPNQNRGNNQPGRGMARGHHQHPRGGIQFPPTVGNEIILQLQHQQHVSRPGSAATSPQFAAPSPSGQWITASTH